MGVIKVTSTHKRVKFKRNFLKKSIDSEAKKYFTKKSIRKLETEIEDAAVKVTVEDLLKDWMVSGAFPNIQCLLAIYVKIPHADTVVECGFSKMGQIMTEKVCSQR